MFDWYGINDIIWQTIRLAFGYMLITIATSMAEGQIYLQAYSNTAGIMLGFILYFIFMSVFEAMMYTLYDCEALKAYDAIFMLDDRKNISNITGCLFFEEF